MQTNVKNCYEIKFMGFIVQQLRYIIFFIFIVLRFPKPMSCQMQKRITSKTAADFSLRKSGHCVGVRRERTKCSRARASISGDSCLRSKCGFDRMVQFFWEITFQSLWGSLWDVTNHLQKKFLKNSNRKGFQPHFRDHPPHHHDLGDVDIHNSGCQWNFFKINFGGSF